MIDKDLEFEKYFQKRLEEDQEILTKLSYSTEEARKIYQQEYDFRKNMSSLNLKIEPQDLTYEVADYYLPEKWEMPRTGKLLYNDEELLNVLKLLVYNLGVKKSLDAIPPSLIEKYLGEGDETL